MADRILVWYLEGVIGDGTEQGPAYYMDRDYVPDALRVMAKRVADADDFTADIKDDGVSILSRRARMLKGAKTEVDAEEFPSPPVLIEAGSLITLDVTSAGAKGITIQLELNVDE